MNGDVLLSLLQWFFLTPAHMHQPGSEIWFFLRHAQLPGIHKACDPTSATYIYILMFVFTSNEIMCWLPFVPIWTCALTQKSSKPLCYLIWPSRTYGKSYRNEMYIVSEEQKHDKHTQLYLSLANCTETFYLFYKSYNSLLLFIIHWYFDAQHFIRTI